MSSESIYHRDTDPVHIEADSITSSWNEVTPATTRLSELEQLVTSLASRVYLLEASGAAVAERYARTLEYRRNPVVIVSSTKKRIFTKGSVTTHPYNAIPGVGSLLGTKTTEFELSHRPLRLGNAYEVIISRVYLPVVRKVKVSVSTVGGSSGDSDAQRALRTTPTLISDLDAAYASGQFSLPDHTVEFIGIRDFAVNSEPDKSITVGSNSLRALDRATLFNVLGVVETMYLGFSDLDVNSLIAANAFLDDGEVSKFFKGIDELEGDAPHSTLYNSGFGFNSDGARVIEYVSINSGHGFPASDQAKIIYDLVSDSDNVHNHHSATVTKTDESTVSGTKVTETSYWANRTYIKAMNMADVIPSSDSPPVKLAGFLSISSASTVQHRTGASGVNTSSTSAVADPFTDDPSTSTLTFKSVFIDDVVCSELNDAENDWDDVSAQDMFPIAGS
jgi:hypothetical protein